jgi:hypothetical protein
MMSKLGACRLFDQSQNVACACVKSEQATAQREIVLWHFYNTHAPQEQQDEEKITRLAKKASSVAKMANLMQKLVAKYESSCIVKLQSPERSEPTENEPTENEPRKYVTADGDENEPPKKKTVTVEVDDEEEEDPDHMEL